MTKTSTVHFTINNLASKSHEKSLIHKETFDFEKEFKDVFHVLDTLTIDVRQEIVENILKTIPDKY